MAAPFPLWPRRLLALAAILFVLAPILPIVVTATGWPFALALLVVACFCPATAGPAAAGGGRRPAPPPAGPDRAVGAALPAERGAAGAAGGLPCRPFADLGFGHPGSGGGGACLHVGLHPGGGAGGGRGCRTSTPSTIGRRSTRRPRATARSRASGPGWPTPTNIRRPSCWCSAGCWPSPTIF